MIKNTAVIFGGTGFIGANFARYLLDNQLIEHVILADIKPLNDSPPAQALHQYISTKHISYVYCDVRKKIQIEALHISVIANFAAIHREPGHLPLEYFETNIAGAENVCAWASAVTCHHIIFTSSIAPYGPSEFKKDEDSIPVPETAYGSSKLCAEKIHEGWQSQQLEVRKLVIVRPGVVFGVGEGGNVSRLIKAVLKGYFFYMGNKNTRKAGVYVKELCHVMWWALEKIPNSGKILCNVTMNPAPSIEEYISVICQTKKVRRFIPAIPYRILYVAAFVIEACCKLVNIKQPISPVRIKKLVRSNDIVAKVLEDENYPYQYTLSSAMADWYKECPEEWK